MSLEWIIRILENNWPMFLRGAGVTLWISVVGTILGTIIGLIVGVIRTIPVPEKGAKKGVLRVVNWLLSAYIEFFRGTPMIVQAMVIYYGSSTVFGIDLKPFNAAIFIILLNTGAYMSETVRGGINSIDVGQIEGAKALGMGYVPMMIYIILPQTFKIIAPQIGNTFVANIKDTSVLNVIAVTELFYITKVAAGTYFRMFEAYTITALIYLTLTLLFNGLLKLIEKYMAGKESYEVLNPAAAK